MNKQDLLSLFEGDAEFINNYNCYHPEVPSTLEDLVEDTWNKIEFTRHVPTSYGYFAIDEKTDVIPWIIGFYVKPEFRKNNSLIEDIKKETNSLFMVAVSNTNTRALKFLAKHCKVMTKDEVKTIFYCKRGQ